MAERLPEFPNPIKGHTNAKYPWDEWFDGSVWLLKQGEDYLIGHDNMRTMTYAAARQRGKRVQSQKWPKVGEQVGIVVRAYDYPYKPTNTTSPAPQENHSDPVE